MSRIVGNEVKHLGAINIFVRFSIVHLLESFYILYI